MTETEDKEELTSKDKIDRMYEAYEGNKKSKRLKLPSKAKVGGGKLKKGWLGVIFMDVNRTISFEKHQTFGGTFQTKDKGYHVTDGGEVMFFEGKYPIVFQRYDRLNPTNFFIAPTKNEIYGQDLVMLRMQQDAIKPKGKGGNTLWWIIGIVVVGYMIYTKFFGGG